MTTVEMTEVRPWGGFTVLADTPIYKVKEIVVNPHQRLSYQSHKHRSEYWRVIQGMATITLNGETLYRNPGEGIDIHVHSKHRVANDADETLVFVEIQTGEYFGEDDIVRYDDDYGRSSLSVQEA